MRSTTNKPVAPTAEVDASRAALTTIEVAVATVEDGIEQLGRLQDCLYSARLGAVATFQGARHHSLNGRDLHLIEECADLLAQRLDWPARLAGRTSPNHLARPLTDAESWQVGRWATSAYEITASMLDVSRLLDVGYAQVVASTADVARSAFAQVTAEEDKQKAVKLMLRLDQLCADERIVDALALVTGNDELVDQGEPVGGDEQADVTNADDAIARCGRVTAWPH
jgi:hypothetical protein